MRETCALFTFVAPKTKKENVVSEIKILKNRNSTGKFKFQQLPWLLRECFVLPREHHGASCLVFL